MSIELLPADKKYPHDVYHVRVNFCRCHPETCCCNKWAIHGPTGEKHSTHMGRKTAEEIAAALNFMRSNT